MWQRGKRRRDAAFSPDGRFIAIAREAHNSDDQLVIIETASGKKEKRSSIAAMTTIPWRLWNTPLPETDLLRMDMTVASW